MSRWFPNPNEFLNSPDEFHVFIIGFCELFCLWTSRKIPDAVMEVVIKEFHYYRLGKFAAAMLLLAVGVLIYLYVIK